MNNAVYKSLIHKKTHTTIYFAKIITLTNEVYLIITGVNITIFSIQVTKSNCNEKSYVILAFFNILSNLDLGMR